MKKYILVTLFCFAIGIGGCKLLEVKTDTQGNPHTKLTDTINMVAQSVQATGSFVPGYGLIATGVSTLLSLVANGILSFANRKRGVALDTVISGVEVARTDYKNLLDEVVNVVKLINPDAGVKAQNVIDKVVNVEQKIDPIISNVSQFAKVNGIQGWLDNRVQSVTKVG